MSKVVTAPVPLPDEGQDITEISQRMSIRGFVDYFQDNLPQPFRVDTASNQMEEVLSEGNLLVACMVKTVRVMKAKKPDSGKTVIIPINSAITFALLPEGTDEVRLGASWEGTFTVAEMITLTLPPPAAKVLSDCKDHDKKNVSKGTILYNLTTFTTKPKVFKKRAQGVKGVSSFGVVHKFVEGEDVRFSTRQLDTKCNLVEIYDIFKGPLRARVFCEGGPDLKQNDVVVFEEKEERTFLVAKTPNNQEPSSSVLSIATDLTGVQVTAVRIKGCNLEPLAKQKTSLKRQSSSRIIQEEGNQYVYAPIIEDVRAEPPPREFEDPEYDNPRKISSETARSMSTESLVSEAYEEMKPDVLQLSHTMDCPTRRHSEDIRDNLYHRRQSISSTGIPPRFSRKFSDSAYDYPDVTIPLTRTDRGLRVTNGGSNCSHNPMSHNFDLNALTKHVVRHVAADWYRLGLYLGVEARVLDTVLADRSRDSTNACIAMLGKWLNGAPGTGCKQREWSTVLEAVGEAIGTEVQRFISNSIPPRSRRKFSDSGYDYADATISPTRIDRGLRETNGGSSTPLRSSRKFSDSAYDYPDATISPTRIDRGLRETNGGSSPLESFPKGPDDARCLPQPRVPSHHLPTVQEQSSEPKPPNQNPPKPQVKPKPQVRPKSHQTHSPQTVTHEQRHPSPATPRQGKGPPAMPQVSLDELKSSKVLNRGTTCTNSPGGPHSPSRVSEDDGYENLDAVTKPPPKPPVKPKPQKDPQNDPRFKVTPTNWQLLHHVARHTGYQWELFCAFLGLERSCIDNLKVDHKGNSLEEKCHEALLLWLQGEGKEPKWWTTILLALKKADLTRVALDIQHRIMAGTLDK